MLAGFTAGIGCGLAGLGGPPFILFTALTHFPKRLARTFGTSAGLFETPFRLLIIIFSTYPSELKEGSTEGPLDLSFSGDIPFLLSCLSKGFFC